MVVARAKLREEDEDVNVVGGEMEGGGDRKEREKGREKGEGG